MVQAVMWELIDLHATKSKGYGAASDPFANYRQVAFESGIPEWLPAVQRVIEKRFRLSNWREASVSIEEELKDIALCAVIALVMYREASHAGPDIGEDVGRVLRPKEGIVEDGGR